MKPVCRSLFSWQVPALILFCFAAVAIVHAKGEAGRCRKPVSDFDADQVKERTVADDFKLAVNQAFPASVDAGAQATANATVTPNYSGSVKVTCDTSAVPGAQCVRTPANPMAISANAAANPLSQLRYSQPDGSSRTNERRLSTDHCAESSGVLVRLCSDSFLSAGASCRSALSLESVHATDFREVGCEYRHDHLHVSSGGQLAVAVQPSLDLLRAVAVLAGDCDRLGCNGPHFAEGQDRWVSFARNGASADLVIA
jgi:hypothetical protein